MITLVSTDLKTIPNNLDRFINADPVSGQFSLIKFKLELGGIKLLPIDHRGVRVSFPPATRLQREKRRTMRAMGRPMQNMIVSRPMVVPMAVMGRRATRESGKTTKFIKV